MENNNDKGGSMTLQRDLDFSNLIKLTIEWNRIGAGGQFDMSPQLRELQHKCLLEELQELKDAIAANDDVEIVDALCDILFVGVYAAFMDLNVERDEYTAGYVYPEIFSTGDESVCTEEPLLYLVEVLENYINSRYYYALIAILATQSIFLKFDLNKAYENVVMSNWTKYPMIEDVVLSDELDYLNNHSKYAGKNVVATEVDGHYVFRIDGGKGKIIKPSCFKEPQLEQFIWR